MKKLICVICLCLSLFIFVGCGSKDISSDSKFIKAKNKYDYLMQQYQTTNDPQYLEYAKVYMKEMEDIVDEYK